MRGAGGIIIHILGRRQPELASEIATRALLNLGKFSGHSKFSTWFYRVARNAVIEFVRTGDPAIGIDSVPEPEAPPFEPTFSLPDGLSVTDRQLLQLVVAGYTNREIGEVFGVSNSTVSYRWKQLQKRLQFLYARR